MANIGFATISIIPSFRGIDMRARAGLAVVERIGKKVGDDAGTEIARGIERKARPDLSAAGRDAGKDLVDGAESRVGGEFTSMGRDAGKDFVQGVEGVAPPDLSAQGDGAGESFIDKLSGFIGGAGKTALLAAGAAAGAILIAGIGEAMEREAVTDRLAAQLGGSEWAFGLGEVAGNLWKQGFGDSTADTAAAVRLVPLLGLTTEDASNDEIEAVAGQLLTFTDVLEQDLLPTGRAVATMLRTDLAGSAEEALDILTRGVQEGGDLGEDLLDTFNEYPALFQRLGLSGEESMGLLVAGLRAGARNSDFVADALKEFQIRATDASEASARGFQLLGLDAEKMTRKIARGGDDAREGLDQVLDGLRAMEDPVKRNEAAVALFGTKAEDLGAALFALDLDGATANLGEHAGATDGLSVAYDNAKTKVETFKRQALDKLYTFIGEQVIPRIEGFAQVWEEKVQPKLELVWQYMQPVIDAWTTWLGVIADIVTKLERVVELVDRLVPDFLSHGFASEGEIPPELRSRRTPPLQARGTEPVLLERARRRAHGGDVLAGHAYWVGDRFGINSPSAELFVPGMDGAMIPRAMVPAPGDAGIALGVQLELVGGSDATFLSWLRRSLRVRGAAA